MKSSELADIVEETILEESQREHNGFFSTVTYAELESIIKLCREGIMGPGKEQYERNGRQKFEDMSLAGLINYIREEFRDQINYGVMVLWRLDQINLALAELANRREMMNLQGIPPIAPIDSSHSLEAITHSSDERPYLTSQSTSLREEYPPEKNQ